MARQGARIEKVIGTLREVEILVNQGATVAEACRKANVTEHTAHLLPLAETVWWTSYGSSQAAQGGCLGVRCVVR